MSKMPLQINSRAFLTCSKWQPELFPFALLFVSGTDFSARLVLVLKIISSFSIQLFILLYFQNFQDKSAYFMTFKNKL